MSDLESRLADLFAEAGHAHHQAYLETNGADAEWPIWYADYLKDRLADMLGARFTKSELIYLLVLVDKRLGLDAPGARWPRYYAKFFIERFA
jgi:NAD(P)H-hydrate epimerase